MNDARVTIEKRKTPGRREPRLYLVVTRNVGGQRQRKFVPTRTTHMRVAERRRRDLERRIEAGHNPFDEERRDTVGEAVSAFLADCRTRGLRPKTVQVYAGVLHLFDQQESSGKLWADVTTADVRRFCVQEHLSEASRRNRLRHLRAFFGWGVKAGRLTTDPTAGVDLPRAKKRDSAFLAPDDVERIQIAIEHDLSEPSRFSAEERAGFWLAPMVTVCSLVGLRRGEAIRLRWSDVDFDRGELRILGSKAGDRRVPIPDVLRPVLERWHEQTRAVPERAGSPLVFASSKGGPLTGDYVGRVFARYCKAAGLPTTAFHGLRHGTATALLMRGVPTAVVQKILGHSQIQVTERYLHVLTDTMRDAMNKAYSTD